MIMATMHPHAIDDTVGALFIGALVTMSIYGITTLQAYFYYTFFPKDGRPTRLLVASIWLLDSLHVVLMCHAVHHYAIMNYGNPIALVDGTWTLFISVAINVIIAFIVQCFFVYRIYHLCSLERRKWVAGIIGVVVVAHFAFGMQTVVYLFVMKKFSRLREVAITSGVPFAVTAITSDVMIAVTLCVLLDYNRSGFADTDTIINKLIVFAINRCLLTSAVAIVEAVVFTVLPNSFYTLAIDFVIGKLYANSLLAVLNARISLRSATHEDFTSTELSTNFNATTRMTVRRQASGLIEVQPREANARPTIIDPEKGSAEVENGSTTHLPRKDRWTLEPSSTL